MRAQTTGLDGARRSAWVLDTAYAAWAGIPLSRADLVLGLDYGRWLTLCRLRRRTVIRHLRSFHRKQDQVVESEAGPQAPAVLRFGTPARLDAWLATVGAEISEGSG